MFRRRLKRKPIKKFISFNRNTSLSSSFLLSKIFLHKGNASRRFEYRNYMRCYKLGEFSLTKKPFFFPHRRKKRR